MTLVSDHFLIKKIKKHNIDILTKYYCNGKVLQINTDGSINDDIKSGIRIEKDYYVDKKLKHVEKLFDSRIEYTFISNEELDKEYFCPNCGMKGIVKDFVDGCPYCRTYYNIEYSEKNMGSKYYYDRIVNSNFYKIVVGIISFIISIIACYFFIKNTSRTFNVYDKSKIVIYGLIMSLIMYYVFYAIDVYVLFFPIKWYKDLKNKKQKHFWNKTKIDKKIFFNNLNYELRKYFSGLDYVIDFDIIDYLSFEDYKKNDRLGVKVLMQIRLVNFINDKFISKTKKIYFNIINQYDETLDLKGGINLIKCPNCGSSINASDKACSYCRTKINYIQNWVIDDN